MKLFKSLEQWQAFKRQHHLSLGFVPTMGNLHKGHLSLVECSQNNNQTTLVSIFVNPTQFNNQSDFTHYPSTLERDLELLDNAGVDYCLLPTEKSIYMDDYRYKLTENKLSARLEGRHRPGHFDGVLTVVMRLLNLAQAQNAYFGEKDYQQYLLIKEMANCYFCPTQIHACPTIREPSGLAYSSRNSRLNKAEKRLAELFARLLHQGTSNQQIIEQLSSHDIQIDYIEEYQGRRFAAVHIGPVRLIDNIPIN